eukprot:scaffold156760_cov20-Prasinocladus_malaysianus.AAC.1
MATTAETEINVCPNCYCQISALLPNRPAGTARCDANVYSGYCQHASIASNPKSITVMAGTDHKSLGKKRQSYIPMANMSRKDCLLQTTNETP